MKAHSAYQFDEFFTSGGEESISPFLKKSSRKYAGNIELVSSIIAAILLAVSFLLSFFNPSLSKLLLLFVYFLAGTKALIETIEDLKHFEINIDVLMTLAAFLSVLINSALEGGLLLVLFSLSGAMEEAVSRRSKSALINLTKIAPTTASVIEEDGHTKERSVKDIQAGEKLLIKAGEVVPLDGIVIEGRSDVNLVHLTGESTPVSKKVSDDVQAGSRNLDGSLIIKVTKSSSESTLSKIIQLIHQAQEMKPKVQRFLDRFGKIYATTIIILAAVFAAVLPYLLSISFFGIEGSIYRALAFLIAASPCALIIATPTAYLSALSACAKKGILLKGGVTLDALAPCKTFAFDKTGTITTGKLTCCSATALKSNSITKEQAVSIAAALEKHAKHPIAHAITEYSKTLNIPPSKLTSFESLPGYGLKGQVEIQNTLTDTYIGHPEYILENTPNLPESNEITKSIQKTIESSDHTLTILLVGSDLFLFEFQDELRDFVATFLQTFKNEHDLNLIMLTGDHESSALKVSKASNIDKVYHSLRPKDKMELISKLATKTSVAMVGDGINDAPALARSTVGIAMGKVGSATAIDAADIVLLQDEISSLSWLLSKAKKTLSIVRQNLSLALGVIVLATTPALLGYIPLWLAVILHEGGTVIVGLNSLRLLKK